MSETITANLTVEGVTVTGTINTAARGPAGADGTSYGGSLLGLWKAQTNATTPPPTNGHVRWNNATQTSATAVYISTITAEDTDLTRLLELSTTGDKLLLQDQDNAANFQRWNVTSTPTFASNACTFAVALDASGGTGTTGFQNNHPLLVALKHASDFTQADIEAAITDDAGFIQEFDVQGDGIDAINSQPFCSKKISSWSSSVAPPIRHLVVGDSLSVFGGEPGLGPWMARAGVIGLKTRGASISGTVTNHNGPSGSNRTDIWITGTGTTFAIGSSAEFTIGGSDSGDIRGDRACIAYVRGPGKGTFDLQYRVNGTGGWTNVPGGAGINTANATADSVFATFNLPTTNFPHYRLRVTNVTGGVVDLAPFVGIYNSTGGGVIQIAASSAGGLDLATHVPATPDAVFNPIWTGLAPDYAINIWADAASVWEEGGAFDAFYNRCTARFASTDWILISRNPSSEPEGIAYSISVARAQAKAQRQWALRNRHTFINGHELCGGSWTVSNARGLAGDVVHPSTAGSLHRDIVLWSKLPLGQIYLGGGFRTGQAAPLFNGVTTASNLNTAALIFTVPLESTQLRLIDAGAPLDSSRTAFINKDTSGSSRRITFNEGGSLGGYFDFGSGLIGFYAGGDNWALGSVSARWNGFFAGLSARQRTETASPVSVIATDHTVFCNAASNTITVNLPQASANSGRILAFVKTDSSGNAVTIDPSGSETINGSATLALSAQWDRCQIQSNGTNWIRIA